MKWLFAFAGVLLNAALLASAQNVTIDNTARYAGNGRYSWTVFVKGDAKSLAQVESVQYTLHPTFQNPVVFGKGANFSYSAVGWGEFNIVAKISYKDKRPPTAVNYWLRLFSRNKAATQMPQRR